MKVFVFEYVVGGGFAGETLPEFLDDAEAMWHAVVKDLSTIEGLDVITLRDKRLPPSRIPGVDIIDTDVHQFTADFRKCLKMSDAVWTIAPESKGILEGLNRDVLDAGKRLLGCHPDTVCIAASKSVTSQRLNNNGIMASPTFTTPYELECDGPVIVKPDDGVGCERTYYFPDLASAQTWSRTCEQTDFVYQQYFAGEALSLSVVCSCADTQLLAVNRQIIHRDNDKLHFLGVDVNAIKDTGGKYARLSEQVTSAIPGLWGYIGIDLIETAYGPVILEINPRTTVSYVGIRSVLDFNLAEKILGLPGIDSTYLTDSRLIGLTNPVEQLQALR